MTGQQTRPRIEEDLYPSEHLRALEKLAQVVGEKGTEKLARTAAVRSDQRDAALALRDQPVDDVSSEYAEGWFAALEQVAQLLGEQS